MHRRQRGIKLAYNIALKTADAVVSVTLYQAVLGDEPILGWRWIVACYLAVAAAALLDGLTTQLVIGLHELSLTRSILADVAVYPAIALAVSTVALVVAYAYDRSPLSALPAAAAGVCLVVGYRAYSRAERSTPEPRAAVPLQPGRHQHPGDQRDAGPAY